MFSGPHALLLFNRLFVNKGLTAGTAGSTRMCIETALLHQWLPFSLEGTETRSKATQFVTFCDECPSEEVPDIARYSSYVIGKKGVTKDSALGTSMLPSSMRLGDDS